MDLEEAIKKTKEEYQSPDRLAEEREVIQKYGDMFHPKNLDKLTKEDFKSFLLIKNNKHWEGIHRQGNLITSDMKKLKHVLKILLDESKPIKERLDYVFPKKKAHPIKGLGRANLTPILMMVYPDKYGAYNKRSADGLKMVGLEPKFKWGASFADKYVKINEVLKKLAAENDMTLFQLDGVWWKVTGGPGTTPNEEEKESEELAAGFGLEPHLRRFLVDNWESTPLGKRYEILSEDGEIIGEEYQAKGAGIIDVLARDKKTKDWVVVELKKGLSGDAVIGQTLRYMGWVEKNMVEKDEGVKGIIVVKEVDTKFEYAMLALKPKSNISCFSYNVQFSLTEV